MKYKLINIISVVILISSYSCIFREPVYDNFKGFTQGTTYSIVFENSENLNAFELRDKVEKILYDFDMSLSLYRDSSIISKVNRNEEVIADSFFIEVFHKAKELTKITRGAFDVTVGPLVKAWGFGPEAKKNFSESKRDSLMQLVGINKVEIRNGRVYKDDPRITLDFNAIAQGYSVDVLYRYLNSIGIKSFLVEIGGEVRVKGDKGGLFWRIGIDKPLDYNIFPGSDLQAILNLKDRSLATSGNYRKFFVENGIKYSHTIDPESGYPVTSRLLSATITADDCTTADAIATACMVMSLEKSIEFIGSHPEFEGFLIYSDEEGNFSTWTSDKLKRYITEP